MQFLFLRALGQTLRAVRLRTCMRQPCAHTPVVSTYENMCAELGFEGVHAHVYVYAHVHMHMIVCIYMSLCE